MQPGPDGIPGNADDDNEFENDLVQLTLRSLKPSSLTGTVTLNLTDPSGAVKLWAPHPLTCARFPA